MVAARVELPRGYVAFIVSDTLLPADFRHQVGIPPGTDAVTAGTDEVTAGTDVMTAGEVVLADVGDVDFRRQVRMPAGIHVGGGAEYRRRAGVTASAGVDDNAAGDGSVDVDRTSVDVAATAAATLRAGAGVEPGTEPGAGAGASGCSVGGTADAAASAAAAVVVAAAAAATVAGAGLSRPGIALFRKHATSRRPLWVVVQSDDPPAPAEALSAVPTSDVQPARGILRHRHSKSHSGDVIEGLGSHAAIPAHVAASDWAADALALATSSPGRSAEEFAPLFRFSADPGSSPDIHSGISSGESSGDEGSDGGDPLSTTAVNP